MLAESTRSNQRSRRRSATLNAGLLLLALLLGAVWAAPLLTPHDPAAVSVAERLLPPGPVHPLGTDHLGRDLLTRLLYGGRQSLATTGVILTASCLIGVPLGLLSGYLGGGVDQTLSALIDLVMAIPQIVLVIFVAGSVGPSLFNTILAVPAVHWVAYARIARAAIVAEREREYVTAARAMGVHPLRIIIRHVAPNVAGPIVAWTALDAGKVLLGVAGLSFLGLGAQPPAPEWGAMLAGGRSFFALAPQLMLYPGVAITLTVLAINLIGDGLRDRFDPHRHLDPRNCK